MRLSLTKRTWSVSAPSPPLNWAKGMVNESPLVSTLSDACAVHVAVIVCPQDTPMAEGMLPDTVVTEVTTATTFCITAASL